MYFYLSLVFLL